MENLDLSHLYSLIPGFGQLVFGRLSLADLQRLSLTCQKYKAVVFDFASKNCWANLAIQQPKTLNHQIAQPFPNKDKNVNPLLSGDWIGFFDKEKPKGNKDLTDTIIVYQGMLENLSSGHKVNIHVSANHLKNLGRWQSIECEQFKFGGLIVKSFHATMENQFILWMKHKTLSFLVMLIFDNGGHFSTGFLAYENSSSFIAHTENQLLMAKKKQMGDLGNIELEVNIVRVDEDGDIQQLSVTESNIEGKHLKSCSIYKDTIIICSGNALCNTFNFFIKNDHSHPILVKKHSDGKYASSVAMPIGDQQFILDQPTFATKLVTFNNDKMEKTTLLAENELTYQMKAVFDAKDKSSKAILFLHEGYMAIYFIDILGEMKKKVKVYQNWNLLLTNNVILIERMFMFTTSNCKLKVVDCNQIEPTYCCQFWTENDSTNKESKKVHRTKNKKGKQKSAVKGNEVFILNPWLQYCKQHLIVGWMPQDQTKNQVVQKVPKVSKQKNPFFKINLITLLDSF